MNEQLQAALAEMLGKANAGIDAGASFLQAQLPDVIQQLLVWKAAISGVWFGIALVALMTICVLAVRVWRSNKSDVDDKMLLTFLGMLPAFGAALALGANLEWLQIWLAPKIYLIEYAASLAK